MFCWNVATWWPVSSVANAWMNVPSAGSMWSERCTSSIPEGLHQILQCLMGYSLECLGPGWSACRGAGYEKKFCSVPKTRASKDAMFILGHACLSCHRVHLLTGRSPDQWELVQIPTGRVSISVIRDNNGNWTEDFPELRPCFPPFLWEPRHIFNLSPRHACLFHQLEVLLEMVLFQHIWI